MKKGSEYISTEIKVDLSTVANKAYDDIAKPAVNSVKFMKDFVTSAFKPYMYRKIKESEYEIQKINDELEQR